MKDRDMGGNLVYIRDVDVCLGQLTEELFHTACLPDNQVLLTKTRLHKPDLTGL